MGCNSDYMESTLQESNASKVFCLLDELAGKRWSAHHWDGYHPSAYNKNVNLDEIVSRLCDKLSQTDVSKYSLEMQMWWRDHKKADKKRVEEALLEEKTVAAKKAAIAKLTKHERQLLGLE
jgi:hypothetical protein